MDGLFAGFTLFDLVALLVFFAFFVLGFAQGTLRRLLGLAITLVAIAAALLLRDPIGDWLARYWLQWPAEYSKMLAFGGSFLLVFVAASVTVQTFYKRQDLFARSALADELIGGLLGIIQGVLLVGMFILVLDSYFRLGGIVPDPDELGFLRQLFDLYDPSRVAGAYRETLIPALFAIAAPVVPTDLRALFP